MKLAEINKLVDNLDKARSELRCAQEKFEGTLKVENHICYENLQIAVDSITMRLANIRNLDLVSDNKIL